MGTLAGTTTQARTYPSNLATGAQRFLSRALARAHAEGTRTANDFLRHFKAIDIMHGLEAAPDLRTRILIHAGIHEKLASKKSTSSAAEDLRIALEEKLTDPSQLLELFSADDRVLYLDPLRLWAFLTEDEFWARDRGDHERSVERMAQLLEDALAEDLLTVTAIIDAISHATIATRLPLDKLQKIVTAALQSGREDQPFSDQSLLECVPLRSLLGYLPLEQVWNAIILERVAKASGFAVDRSTSTVSVGVAPLEAVEVGAPRAALKSSEEPALEFRRSVPPPKPVQIRRPVQDEPMPASERPNAEEEARQRVIERLISLNRLPPRHDMLSTPILLSIESMCSELLTLASDDAREACIRDSFPNQNQLVTALLALIELLEPGIDVNDPVIRDADADSLIKVVLFEEHYRYEQAHAPARPATTVPPPASTMRRSTSAVHTPGVLPAPAAFKTVPPPLPVKRAR